MSLFTRTTAQVDELEKLLTTLETDKSSPLPERKNTSDKLRALLTDVQPAVDKFVAKADAGERDPSTRIYGAGMVTKIRALATRLSSLSERSSPLTDAVDADFEVAERKREEEEAEQRARDAAAATEAARLQAEREEAERVEAKRKAEAAEREAAQKREEDAARKRAAEEAERKRAEEKRLAEERARKEAEEKSTADAKAKQETDAKQKAEAEAAAAREASDSAGVKLTIKTTRGKTFTLEGVPATTTVDDLKARIETVHSVPKAAQRLIFQGRLLADAKTIDTYKISDGSAIHLVENAAAVAAAKAAKASSSATKPLVPPGTVCHLERGRDELDAIVSNCGSSRLVVVDWSAAWCGPCRAIAPVFERLSKHFSDVTFVTVDTEASPANAQLAAEKSISGYPTFHYMIAGRVVHEFSGANASAIEAGIKRCRPMVTAPSASTPAGGPAASSRVLTGGLLAALTKLKQNTSMEEFVRAVQTMITLVQNVIRDPTLERFRKVRMGNTLFNSRVGSKQGGVDCMQAFGFRRTTENGEDFLVMDPQDAVNPELVRVSAQLQSAVQEASRLMGNSSAGGASGMDMGVGGGAPTGMGAGGAPGGAATDAAGLASMLGAMGGMGGAGTGGAGMGPSMGETMAQLLQDPEFMRIAQELQSDPNAISVMMQARTAMDTGDMATMQRLQNDPTLSRLRNALSANPAFMNAMMRQMAEGGFNMPGMGGMGGMGGFPGMGGMGGMGGAPPAATGAPTGTNPTGTAPAQPPAPAPPQYPGAPSTAEEEERLLQEAIRLSMQDQASNQTPNEPKGSDKPDGEQN